jgi:hypothetical protein
LGATHVKVESTSQEKPCPLLDLLPFVRMLATAATAAPQVVEPPVHLLREERLFTGYLPLFEPQPSG